MAQYIDKDALVAEIERRWKYDQGFQTEDETKAYQRCCDDILYVIKTLEVKEVDLEKYYHDFLQKEWFGKNCIRTMSEMMAFTAKHFFELGLSSQLSWKDIERIAEIGMDFMNSEDSDNLNDEEYYTEILNRFKVQKGEEV